MRGGKPNNGDAGRSDCGICHHIGGKPRSQPTAPRANVGFATDTVANSFRAVFSAARVRFATPCRDTEGRKVYEITDRDGGRRRYDGGTNAARPRHDGGTTAVA